MDSMKPAQWVGLGLLVVFLLWAIYSHLQYFGNVSFLGGLLLIEILIACLWKYDVRFFALLMVAFLWAGMRFPMRDAWTGGRWLVLAAGTVVGTIVWLKSPRSHYKFFHLTAFFCVGAAFVSASVSPFVQMASFKALSLLLLFLYCSSGARLAVLGREERFFAGLLWAGEIVVYVTAVCYLALGEGIFGNPNALGAAMSIGLFPLMLWGWVTAEGPILRTRRLVALLLCVYLIFFSMERSGVLSMTLVTIAFCLALHQYKLLIKVSALMLLFIAISGMVAPLALNERLADLKEAILYKGHKDEGVLGSRKGTWDQSIETIKQHPWFGTGYGTSPNGEDPGLHFGIFSSTMETAREHGSSYITIAEWVGLLGVAPFAGLIALTLHNVWRTCSWMRRTANPRHYAIPLAMITIGGLTHAFFEDWLFAVGYYVCVYFWFCSFVLVDLVPVRNEALVSAPHDRRPAFVTFGAVAPNR